MVSIAEIYDRLSPEPLQGDDLQRYYVDSFAGRGDNPMISLKRLLLGKPDGKLQILFSGYRGCGKSTELNKLQREISDDFIGLNFSAVKELDPVNINYVELFVLAMEKLFDVVGTNHIRINPQLFESVRQWSRSAEIENIRELTGEASLEAGAEVEVIAPLFARFFTKMRLGANASTTTKKTVIQNIEPRLSDLISHCNALIREIKSKLPEIGKKGLIIIIEDLDKLSVEKAEELFFNHSHILSTLQTHVIFTFPISLRHHPKANVIKGNFDEDFELPMLKVHDKQGKPFNGRDAMREIVTCRIGTACVESPALVNQFIDMSGGCLRDLFRMIRNAADNALNNEREVITEADYTKSFFRLRRDYENTIAEKRVENTVIISVAEYYDTLKTLALSSTKKVDNTEAVLDLRQNLCILGYNDEGWCDVHPVVRTILCERFPQEVMPLTLEA
ncbi:MAG: P-loop NTPase fold protein [Chlorobium sp.]